MISHYVSSGDVPKLLMGKHTDGHRQLWQRFWSNQIPNYNAKHSPIDAFRIGAILEERFYLTLPDDYIPQKKVYCLGMDVCRSTLDFTKVVSNRVVDFIEMKTCFFTDFLKFQPYKNAAYEDYVAYLKLNYKNNYNQCQFQMMCADISECVLQFVEVKNYDDKQNYERTIQPEECIGFRLKRDDEVIEFITERVMPFQQIKDIYK